MDLPPVTRRSFDEFFRTPGYQSGDFTIEPLKISGVGNVFIAQASSKATLWGAMSFKMSYMNKLLEGSDGKDIAEAGSRFIKAQVRQTKEAALHLMESGLLPVQSEIIPIIAPPDGGIHIGRAFQNAYTHFGRQFAKMFPITEDLTVPQQVWDQAAKTGIIVICDSVVADGLTIQKILGQMPKSLTGPDGKPIDCIIFTNFAAMEREGLAALASEPQLAVAAIEKNCKILICAAETNELTMPDLDIGNVLAQKYPGTRRYWRDLVKRTPTQESDPLCFRYYW